MLPYKTILILDKESRTPIYIQIANGFIKNISSGIISSGTKLPGARTMAELLSINRRTVTAAYEELESQGWIEVEPNRGCFVSTKIPDIRPKSLTDEKNSRELLTTSFSLNKKFDFLDYEFPEKNTPVLTTIDDGYPDIRLSPLKELSKNISFAMNTPQVGKLMNYTQSYNGDLELRKELIKYLAETRSIKISLNNILITRGSLAAFYLIFQTILNPNDNVIVTEPGWLEGHNTIKLAKGKLIHVPVDEFGMDVDAVENICKRKTVRAIFIVPHHHYPTMVSLSPSRRMKLLALAKKYKFAIIEDDFDYDFHYSSSPILPMASADNSGVVAYVGSFSKTIAPSLRTGFIVAPENLIKEMARLSKFIDSYGNTSLERAIAMLFKSGEIRRYLKKANNTYRNRRDYFCQLLYQELGDYIDFKEPEGGLAVWIRFKKPITLKAVIAQAKKTGLRLPNKNSYCATALELNATRLGFASMNEVEMKMSVSQLRRVLEEI